MHLELTTQGYLRIPAEVIAERFGDASSVLISIDDGDLLVGQLGSRAVGGFILKRTNLRGDGAVLVIEPLREGEWHAGPREVVWDPGARALRIPIVLGAAAEPLS